MLTPLTRHIENILITGGNGLLGTHLKGRFQAEGDSVSVLSRRASSNQPMNFVWDIDKRSMDPAALSNATSIIHLAGAGIADKRWTKKYKQSIIDSRIKSTELLYEQLNTQKHHVKCVVSASAVGIYGDTDEVWAEEDTHPVDSFLGNTCVKWEKAVRKIESLNIRVVILRIGVVLAKNGGALPVMAKPIRYFVGAPLGTGKQFLSWIHIDDLCRLFDYAIRNEKMHGIFNAVAPGPVENKFFIRKIAKLLKRPVWPFNIPTFLLRIILGEKAVIVTSGQRVSSEKVRMSGFRFHHTDLDSALKDLL